MKSLTRLLICALILDLATSFAGRPAFAQADVSQLSKGKGASTAGAESYQKMRLGPSPANGFPLFLNPSSSATQPLSGPQAGQVVVDTQHPAWLRYQGGGPFFMCGPGDPEGFFYRGTRNPDGTRSGDQQALIDKLAGTGANSIYLMAIRSHGGDGDASQNPFVDSDPTKGLDEHILQQWDQWLSQLDSDGILIFFIFYDDGASIWNTGDDVGSAEGAFLSALVNRYKDLKNLIWVVAEEYNETYTSTRASNIAATIRASDDRTHPIAIHKLTGLSFSEFANDPSIDQFAIQYGSSSPQGFHNALVSAWSAAGGRYNLNLAEGHPEVTGTQARHRSWAVAMGGGYMMHLGWDIANTDTGDLVDCGRLVSFMESTEFQTMSPHDELANGSTSYVLADPGSSYIAYTSSAASTMGIRNLTSGTYDLHWFDAATGASVTQSDVAVSGGDTLWAKPNSIGAEVALNAVRTGPLLDTPLGDVSGDGTVNVVDVQLCVNQVLKLSPATPEADVNSDGYVNVQDVQLIVNIILSA